MAKPGGLIVVSVPVEVGPALLIKQMGRWWANRLTSYGYERYSWRELIKAGVGLQVRGLVRTNLYSHKGFDYRVARAALLERVSLDATRYSPLSWTGPTCASTVFWAFRAPIG
jgi:hypothetical protein